MAKRGLQRNNQSPMGYGQPNMRARLIRPQDEEAVRQFEPQEPQSPQPAFVPGTFAHGLGKHATERPDLFTEDERRATQGLAQGYQQSQQQQPSLVKKWMQQQQQTPNLPAAWQQQMQQRNTGVNPQQGYYDQAYGQNGPALNPQVEQARQQLSTPQGGNLYDAFKNSVQQGYTDIAGTEGWGTGKFASQLQGFGDLGATERGSYTLKKSMGKILSDYDVTQPGVLQQVLQDPRFQELTGGQATIVDHPNMDQIDFDGPNGPMQPVDLIGNAQNGAGTNWWWGTDTQGPGPAAPANQIYNQAIPGMEQLDQQALLAQMGPMQGQAMDFLQWLMSQQQNGQLMSGGMGPSPVTF